MMSFPYLLSLRDSQAFEEVAILDGSCGSLSPFSYSHLLNLPSLRRHHYYLRFYWQLLWNPSSYGLMKIYSCNGFVLLRFVKSHMKRDEDEHLFFQLLGRSWKKRLGIYFNIESLFVPAGTIHGGVGFATSKIQKIDWMVNLLQLDESCYDQLDESCHDQELDESCHDEI